MILLIVAVDLEILFESLIHAFSLSVALGVISGGEVKFHVEGLSE